MPWTLVPSRVSVPALAFAALMALTGLWAHLAALLRDAGRLAAYVLAAHLATRNRSRPDDIDRPRHSLPHGSALAGKDSAA